MASRELGKLITDATVDDLIKAIREVKKDTMTLHLQNEYFKKMKTN